MRRSRSATPARAWSSAVGEGVGGFAPGDRVACAGAGYANHAELVVVPENLVALVPDGVPLEQAAFATIGAIALQGLRVAQPDARRGRRGHRPRPDRAARRAAAARQRLPRARHRPRPGARRAAPSPRAPSGAARPGELPGDLEGRRDRRLRRRLRAGDRRRARRSAPIQLAAELCRPKGRVAVVGRDGDGPRPAQLLREGARAAHEHVLRARPLRPALRGARPRLPDLLRALDREPQPPGVPRPARLGLARRVDQLDAETLALRRRGAGLRRARRGRRGAPSRWCSATTPTRRRPARSRARAVRRRRRPRTASASPSSAPATTPRACCCPRVQKSAGTRPSPSSPRRVPRRGAAPRSSASRPAAPTREAVFGDQDVDLVFVATRHDSHARARDPRAARRQGRLAREAARGAAGGRPRGGRGACARPAASWRSATTAASRPTRARCAPPSRAARARSRSTTSCRPARRRAGTWHLDPIEGGGRDRRRGLPLRRPLQLPGRRAADLGLRARARPRRGLGRLDRARCSASPTARPPRSSTWRARARSCPRSASRSPPTGAPRAATTSG